MKRSEINHVLREAEAFIKTMGFNLPPFAFWPLRNGMKPGTNMMKSGITCWDGTSQIRAWQI